MTERRTDPVALADDEARALARDLLTSATHAALAVTDAASGTPSISRVAFQTAADGVPMILISGLAPHTAALRAHPDCAFMLGDPGPKGDPMAAPRLMVKAQARFVAADDPDRPALREAWLQRNPKAKVYIDLPDFSFCRLIPQSALLNGGFGRAFRLTPEDLRP